LKRRLGIGRRGAIGVVVVAAVVGGALTAALVSGGGGGGTSPTPKPIEGRATLSPSIAFFGDTVAARVDVTLDRSRVHPGSVRVQADFTPWKPVTAPRRVRRDESATTYIGTTFLLRCLEITCTSPGDTSVQDFGRASVSYVAKDTAGGKPHVLHVPWPQLVVDSRYAQNTVKAAGGRAAAWEADLRSLPAVSYAISPGLLFALLLAGSLVLVLGAGGLAYAARPPAARPAPVRPQAPTAPVLTPLERALSLLEVTDRLDGAGDQRRALECVAEELAKQGDSKLARAARALAWSEQAPATEDTNGVAASARSRLKEALRAPLE
jgi:hypothetical protein